MISKNTHIKITVNDAYSDRILSALDNSSINIDYIKFGSAFPCYGKDNDEFDMLRDIYVSAYHPEFANNREFLEHLRSCIANSEECMPLIVSLKDIKLIDTEVFYTLVETDCEFDEDIRTINTSSSVNNLLTLLFNELNGSCQTPKKYRIKACINDRTEGAYYNPSHKNCCFFSEVIYEATNYGKHPFLFMPTTNGDRNE